MEPLGEAAGVPEFIAVSVGLTGFDEDELRATGLVDAYWSTVLDKAGRERCERLIATVRSAGGRVDRLVRGDSPERELASSITHLWYTGAWPGTAHTAARDAYARALVWRTFDGLPPGTRAAGYGSWARPPAGAPGGPGDAA